MPTTPEKDTVYIDIDDEITSMVGKVQASKSKVVALVLPKRATVLQSIVNMKLLKKAADHANKHLVLITSEAGLLPLAGAAGVYVAKNLQSKPEIPSVLEAPDPHEELQAAVPAAAAAAEEAEKEVDKQKPVGELAGDKPTPKPKETEETIEVDNDGDELSSAVGATATKDMKPKKAKKAKGEGKNKIPNFDKFRKRLFLIGGGLVVLIVFWILATFVLPKASIVIKTDTSNSNATVDFTASPTAQTADVTAGILPAKEATAEKADSQKAPATGQKDIGAKATGAVTMVAKNCSGLGTPSSVPAGSTLTSGGAAFSSTGTASFAFDSISGGCINFKSGSVGITAQSSGPGSNLSSATFAVTGRSDVTASGNTSGGTSQIAKVVNATDVENAKSKMTNSDDGAKAQLQKNLQDGGYIPLPETFTVKNAQVTVSPNVGQEGEEVTVTSKGTYSMLGIKEDDLKKVTNETTKSDVDEQKQQIQEYGFNKAVFKLGKAAANGNLPITMDTQLTLGPKIDQDELKTQIAGRKKGDTENIIKGYPGVKEVDIHYSPFWVSKTPKKPTKITITLEKAN